MPVEFANPNGEPVKLKFIQNVCYEGKDYGPDYDTKPVLVEAKWAFQFVNQGRAVEVEQKAKEEKTDAK